MELFQHTIKKTIRIAGVGLHSGKPVRLTIKPAKTNSGLRFVRSDLARKTVIPAFMTRVIDTRLATTIAEDDISISTTEHLLAALSGMGIDNALIELDGAEVPIMDGSAGPFVHTLNKISRRQQKSTRKMIKINREIVYQDGDRYIKVIPFDGFKITCSIDFEHQTIKKQSYTFTYSPKKFAEEIANARTFGFAEEVDYLRGNGLALGGSLENAVVIDRHGVMNQEGLRFNDEFVRHKILDLMGDIALLGCPILGHVTAYKSGHGQHLALLKEIAANPDCWDFVKFEKRGERRMLEQVASSSRVAGNMILPFLLPHPTQLVAGDICPA